MYSSTRNDSILAQQSQLVISVCLAAVLLVGGLGGYALRAATVQISAASEPDTAPARIALIPRSAREDDGVGVTALGSGPTNIAFLMSEHTGSPENPALVP